jgi:tRNA nucleotidyltransferase (CCA-adding enzyme)
MAKNYSSQLRAYLPGQVLELLLDAGVRASETGQETFLVGGVVRDLLLGRTSFDFDLVVEGDAIELAKILAENKQVKLTIHSRFGTAKLKFSDFSIDIATARRESYSRPGALPDVKPGTIVDDLFRRDFSINAMALHLTPGNFGTLIDLYHGQNDTGNHLIRILHPDSFIDDATRIFRAIRYEQRLGFNLETETAQLLRRDISMIKTIGGDRIRNELMLILMEEFPERDLRRADELGVLKELHLSLSVDEWLIKRFEQARQIQKHNSIYPVYLCLLIYRLSHQECEKFLRYINFPNILAETMRQTLQLKGRLNFLASPELKSSDVYRLLCIYRNQAIQANMLAAQSDVATHRMQMYFTRLCHSKTLLTGDHLMQMGVPSGPVLGRMLDALHEAKLNAEVRTKKDEENLVRSLLADL